MCVVITARDIGGTVEAVKKADTHRPDLIEIRLDYISGDIDTDRIRGASGTPMIATYRRGDQGGLYGGTDADRMEVLLSAAAAGFEYVDVELTSENVSQIIEEIRGHGAEIIVSHHDYEGTPELGELKGILAEQVASGAGICKIVGTATSQGDNLVYLQLIHENPGVELVCFGMGKAGLLSRVFSPVLGGAFTYASLEAGMESAPGQLTVSDLRRIYGMMGV